MNTRIKQTDYEMTDKVADYLDGRLAAIERMLGDDADETRCEVEVGRATGRHKHSDYQYFAEIIVKRGAAPRLVARNHEPSINAAIDNAKDEMLRQLRKEKTARKSKGRRDAGKAKRLIRS
ncbi:MAG: HPF/RaiA family ribosome-associated protein [Candidatus Kaiserbacteria bacterium]|nr:HPF/RaiA family ribosome-associated protein [Candidatus Kaiserbacteria bacterium]